MKKVVIFVLFLFLVGFAYADPPIDIDGKGGYSGKCTVSMGSDYTGTFDYHDGIRTYDHRWAFTQEEDRSWTGKVSIIENDQYGKPNKCFLDYTDSISCQSGNCTTDSYFSYSPNCNMPNSNTHDAFTVSDVGPLWYLYGVSCFDDWWCIQQGTNPNYPNYKSYGQTSRYDGNWSCSQNAYGLKTDINFSGYEIIGPLCEKGNLDAEYSVVIDAKDERGSQTDEEARALKDPTATVLKKDKDVTFNIVVRSSEYTPEVLDLNAEYEQKISCGIPKWFEIELNSGAMYYDDTLVFSNLNVFGLVEKSRRAIRNEVISKIGFLIKNDGGDFNDYLISSEEIRSRMVMHGWTTTKEFGDSIFFNDSIKLRIELTDNNEINAIITEEVIGYPVNPEVYDKGFAEGKVFARKIERRGPVIKIAEGDTSLLLYDGMIRKLVEELPKAIRSEELLKRDSFMRVEDENGKFQTYVHFFPQIEKDTLDSLEKYLAQSEICCLKDEPTPIPAVDVGVCPQTTINSLEGNIEIHMDADLDAGGWGHYFEESDDGIISIKAALNNVDFNRKNKDTYYCNYKCGVPNEIDMTVTLVGKFYDNLGDPDFFSPLREKFIQEFPPEDIKYFLSRLGKPIILSQSQIVTAIEEGDVKDTIDDSQIIYETMNIKITNEGNGNVLLTLSDDINFQPKVANGQLYNSKPLSKVSNSVYISSKNPGGDILFSSLADSIISTVYQVSKDARFEGVQIETRGDGNILTVNYNKKFNIDNLLWLPSARKDPNCCYIEGKTEEEPLTGPGLSLYYLRNPENYSLKGTGYLITSNREITQNVTKDFVFPKEGYLIYRIADEDLRYYNYTLEGISVYYPAPDDNGDNFTYFSNDGLFKINMSKNPDTRIQIERVNIEGLNLSDVSVREVENPDRIDLRKIIMDAKEVIQQKRDYFSFLSDFMSWSRG